MKPLESKKLQELILRTALADYQVRQSLPQRKAPMLLELDPFFRDLGVQRISAKLLADIREALEHMVGPAMDKLQYYENDRHYVIHFNGQLAFEYPFLFFGTSAHKIPQDILTEFKLKPNES